MKAVSNRFLVDTHFLRLESNTTHFWLLLETAPDGSRTGNNDNAKGLGNIREATSRYR